MFRTSLTARPFSVGKSTVHAFLYETGDGGGIGSDIYYHTKVFRDQCIKFGLCCEFLNTRYGWTITRWPDTGVPESYRAIVALLRRKMPAGTGGFAKFKAKGKDLPVPGHTILFCGCEGDDRTVYVKKSVLQSGGVTCSFCRQEFRVRKSSR